MKSQTPACHSVPPTNVHFVTDNATHALASTATVELTFNEEEKGVVIRHRWTPEEPKERDIMKNPQCNHGLHALIGQ